MHLRSPILSSFCGLSLAIALMMVNSQKRQALGHEGVQLPPSPFAAQATSTPAGPLPQTFFSPQEASQGFVIPVRTSVFTVCNPGTTATVPLLRTINNIPATAYVFSGRELYNFLKVLHQGGSMESIWDGKTVATSAYRTRYPQSGFVSADAEMMRPNQYNVMVEAQNVQFRCNTGVSMGITTSGGSSSSGQQTCQTDAECGTGRICRTLFCASCLPGSTSCPCTRICEAAVAVCGDGVCQTTECNGTLINQTNCNGTIVCSADCQQS